MRSAPLVLVAATLCALACGGCNIIGGAISFWAYHEQREGSHTVDAEYRGLPDKSFAVLVTAPAVLQSERPGLTAKLAMGVSDNLAQNSGATGFVPGARIIQYQYNRPNWVARPMGEVAKELGVDRIIFIDISEYRLRDPGNQYVWDGVTSATIAVYETDSAIPDDVVYQKIVQVKFPDNPGFSPTDIPEAAVNSELTRRLSERTAWLFYTHDEKNILKY
ncbi:MAG: hypothetical protein QM783_11420 [Phycisphaerales bacterium]